MGIKKLLANLKIYLDKGERKKKAHCDHIDSLLEMLREKEIKLKKKLKNETGSDKRKKLKMELKIVSAQLKKGTRRREDLRKKCK